MLRQLYRYGISLSFVSVALAGCRSSDGKRTVTTTPATAPAPTNAADRTWSTATPAQVLGQYLNLSLARRHESAYALLSAKDQRARAWVTYVNAEREADRLRDQVGALGQPTYKITWIKVGTEMTTAIVRLTTGIGTSKVRFVLHKDEAGWRVDYEASWQPVDEPAATAAPVTTP